MKARRCMTLATQELYATNAPLFFCVLAISLFPKGQVHDRQHGFQADSSISVTQEFKRRSQTEQADGTLDPFYGGRHAGLGLGCKSQSDAS
jgi:hypothetical protein